MKKLTAAIFASLLTVVSVGAARADIASQGYVDEKVGERVSTETYETQIGTVTPTNMGTTADTVVGGINEAMTKAGENATAIGNLEEKVGDETDGLVKQVADLNNTVNDETNGLVKQVEALDTIVNGDGDGSVKAALNAIGGLKDQVNDEATGLSATKDIADANKTAITKLNGDDTVDGSVAKTVKDAVGTATTTLTTSIDGKQVKSEADYQMGNATGTWTALTDDEKAALQSGATAENIAQIATNESAITKLNGGDTVDGSVAKTVKDAVDGVTDKIGTVTAENMGTTAGTVVGAIKEVNDDVETRLPRPDDACSDSKNKCVLVSAGKGNYFWEVIARGVEDNNGGESETQE